MAAGREREAKALRQAVPAMAAAEAIAELLLATDAPDAAQGDPLGATQACAEAFVASLTYLRQDVIAAAPVGWISPDFRVPWIARNCEELAERLLARIDRDWVRVVARFGRVLDRDAWDEKVDEVITEWRGSDGHLAEAEILAQEDREL
jgi:hypothetical protein